MSARCHIARHTAAAFTTKAYFRIRISAFTLLAPGLSFYSCNCQRDSLVFLCQSFQFADCPFCIQAFSMIKYLINPCAKQICYTYKLILLYVPFD